MLLEAFIPESSETRVAGMTAVLHSNAIAQIVIVNSRIAPTTRHDALLVSKDRVLPETRTTSKPSVGISGMEPSPELP